jgi:hypothetical protein
LTLNRTGRSRAVHVIGTWAMLGVLMNHDLVTFLNMFNVKCYDGGYRGRGGGGGVEIDNE